MCFLLLKIPIAKEEQKTLIGSPELNVISLYFSFGCLQNYYKTNYEHDKFWIKPLERYPSVRKWHNNNIACCWSIIFEDTATKLLNSLRSLRGLISPLPFISNLLLANKCLRYDSTTRFFIRILFAILLIITHECFLLNSIDISIEIVHSIDTG